MSLLQNRSGLITLSLHKSSSVVILSSVWDKHFSSFSFPPGSREERNLILCTFIAMPSLLWLCAWPHPSWHVLFLKMTRHGFVPVMFLSSVIRKNTPLWSSAIQKQVKQNQILLLLLFLAHLLPSRQSLYRPHYFPTLCRRKRSTRECVEWLACACAHSWGLPVFFSHL